MKEKFQSFKEKLTTDKKFKTQFISIATACVVVIALAIAIPVGIHNSKVPATPVESESSSQNEFEISLTANAQAEITTEAQTEPETEAQTQATQPAPKPTQSVTKAQKPAQSVTKTQSATKPAAKASPNPNLTASEYQQLLDAGMPESLAKKSTSTFAINCWDSDVKAVNGEKPTFNCPDCGKISGGGTHGTCAQFSTDGPCPVCGEYVKAWICHSCKY